MAENQELDEPLEEQLINYLKPTRPTPAQTKFLEELSITTEQLNALLEKTETVGLSLLQQKEYEFLAAQKVELQKKLKRLEGNRKGQQRYRQRKKERLREVAQAFPEVADQLNRMNRNKRGRSRLEEEYPELQQAIMEITGNSGSEQTANMTLKQLTEELWHRGINVSRTAVYLRLMPRLLGTPEAKRHVNTVPVKLRHCGSHQRYKKAGAGRGGGKQQDDRAFADTTLRYLKKVEENIDSRDGVSAERGEGATPHLSTPPIPPPPTQISPTEARIVQDLSDAKDFQLLVEEEREKLELSGEEGSGEIEEAQPGEEGPTCSEKTNTEVEEPHAPTTVPDHSPTPVVEEMGEKEQISQAGIKLAEEGEELKMEKGISIQDEADTPNASAVDHSTTTNTQGERRGDEVEEGVEEMKGGEGVLEKGRDGKRDGDKREMAESGREERNDEEPLDEMRRKHRNSMSSEAQSPMKSHGSISSGDSLPSTTHPPQGSTATSSREVNDDPMGVYDSLGSHSASSTSPTDLAKSLLLPEMSGVDGGSGRGSANGKNQKRGGPEDDRRIGNRKGVKRKTRRRKRKRKAPSLPTRTTKRRKIQEKVEEGGESRDGVSAERGEGATPHPSTPLIPPPSSHNSPAEAGIVQDLSFDFQQLMVEVKQKLELSGEELGEEIEETQTGEEGLTFLEKGLTCSPILYGAALPLHRQTTDEIMNEAAEKVESLPPSGALGVLSPPEKKREGGTSLDAPRGGSEKSQSLDSESAMIHAAINLEALMANKGEKLEEGDSVDRRSTSRGLSSANTSAEDLFSDMPAEAIAKVEKEAAHVILSTRIQDLFAADSFPQSTTAPHVESKILTRDTMEVEPVEDSFMDAREMAAQRKEKEKSLGSASGSSGGSWCAPLLPSLGPEGRGESGGDSQEKAMTEAAEKWERNTAEYAKKEGKIVETGKEKLVEGEGMGGEELGWDGMNKTHTPLH